MNHDSDARAAAQTSRNKSNTSTDAGDSYTPAQLKALQHLADAVLGRTDRDCGQLTPASLRKPRTREWLAQCTLHNIADDLEALAAIANGDRMIEPAELLRVSFVAQHAAQLLEASMAAAALDACSCDTRCHATRHTSAIRASVVRDALATLPDDDHERRVFDAAVGALAFEPCAPTIAQERDVLGKHLKLARQVGDVMLAGEPGTMDRGMA